MIELIDETYHAALAEMELFVSGHPKGHFLQAPSWRLVKPSWTWWGVLVREEGRLLGTLSLLIRPMPGGFSLLYAPRGPVCSPHDGGVLTQLFQGAEQIARQCHSCALLLDPDLSENDKEFLTRVGSLGFTCRKTQDFEGIQPRFVFRLDIAGRNEDAVFAGFASKTRYQVRLARRRGVQVEFWPGDVPVPEAVLADFSALMRETGQRDGFLVRSQDYFQRLLTALGSSARLYLARLEGQAIAGTIAVQFGDKTWYLYGASSNHHREAMPNYLLQWEMIRWAIASNCRVYDFRGVSGNVTPDSPLYGLYRFKKGFGGQLTAFCGELVKVYCPFTYQLLRMELWGNRVLRQLRRPSECKKRQTKTA